MDDIIQDIKNALGTDLPKWATESTLAEIKKILEGSGDGLKSLKNANENIGSKFKSGTFIGGLYQAQLESEKLASKTSVVRDVCLTAQESFQISTQSLMPLQEQLPI